MSQIVWNRVNCVKSFSTSFEILDTFRWIIIMAVKKSRLFKDICEVSQNFVTSVYIHRSLTFSQKTLQL